MDIAMLNCGEVQFSRLTLPIYYRSVRRLLLAGYCLLRPPVESTTQSRLSEI